jgi:hypothetical protein
MHQALVGLQLRVFIIRHHLVWQIRGRFQLSQGFKVLWVALLWRVRWILLNSSSPFCMCFFCTYRDNKIQFPKHCDMLMTKLIHVVCNLTSLSNVIWKFLASVRVSRTFSLNFRSLIIVFLSLYVTGSTHFLQNHQLH